MIDVTYGEIEEVDVQEVHVADGSKEGAPADRERSVTAKGAVNIVFPLLGFLGFAAKSPSITSRRRSRHWSSKGRKRFCVDTGSHASRAAWPASRSTLGVFIETATQSLSLIVDMEILNRYRGGPIGNIYLSSLS